MEGVGLLGLTGSAPFEIEGEAMKVVVMKVGHLISHCVCANPSFCGPRCELIKADDKPTVEVSTEGVHAVA
jgi:hypothetical protein